MLPAQLVGALDHPLGDLQLLSRALLFLARRLRHSTHGLLMRFLLADLEPRELEILGLEILKLRFGLVNRILQIVLRNLADHLVRLDLVPKFHVAD